MVYPFLLMVAGTTKSQVDEHEFKVVPTFLREDRVLYRKHIEALFLSMMPPSLRCLRRELKEISPTEDIGLAPEKDGGVDTLPARVLRRQYLGDKTSYRVQLDGGATLQVDRHGAMHDAHQAGDAVALRLDPATTRVLAA